MEEDFNQQDKEGMTTSPKLHIKEDTPPLAPVHSPSSIDASPFPQNARAEEVTCDVCTNRRAVKTCLTCNASYCEEDVQHHYRIPALQRHNMVDVTAEAPQGDQRHPGLITALPPPGEMRIEPSATDSVIVSWTPPEDPDIPRRFRIVWQCEEETNTLRVSDVCQVEVSELKLGRKYDFAIATEGENYQSMWVRTSHVTVIPPPTNLVIDNLNSTSITLRWTKDPKIPQSFIISYRVSGGMAKAIHTKSCSKTLSDLQPDTEYVVSVSTLMPGGEQSKPESVTISTSSCLLGLLVSIGLSAYYEGKLKLSDVLEINHSYTSEEHLNTMQSLPWIFLKKLLLANMDARSVRCVTPYEETYDLAECETKESECSNNNSINPLDLITALLLCSDDSLKQEMVRKMALCQFAVPLLLPNCETKQVTLMLWTMREVVKKFIPFTPTTQLVEESIVVSEIPLVSLVSLGKDSLNKYQILNRMHNNAFVHRDMDCDDAPRKISDGLVEISWCLPCGNKNIDLFDKPVAMANLRGDIRSFKKQFSFLCDVSAAVFIFSDDCDSSRNFLKDKNAKAQILLVSNGDKQAFRNPIRGKPSFEGSRPFQVIFKKKQHDADFVKKMQSAVTCILNSKPNIVTIQNMAEAAERNGILVDEKSSKCQTAQRMANEITSKITDTSEFKNEHLPLQGIRKQLCLLEKEKCKDSLEIKLQAKEEIVKRLQGFKMAHVMRSFIHAILDQSIDCPTFLQWMKINLDRLSRQNLSGLKEEYKELCQSTPERKDLISDLDKKMSDCSLGLEHLFRELGQLYEWSEYCSLENSLQKKQIEQLPLVYAQMLLEGLPIELVNGDTSDVPLKWIKSVLTCLHREVKMKSKIKVVTVLGVQGTGKSTLLNTLFGVQFAVSTGRCTRGAFMQLIRVNQQIRKELQCDFVMIIDTEGLKAPELAQQKDSQDLDHKLATLVVGLSDITIINMTMEAFAEIRGILQMVVYNLLGIKEKMAKPKCHFVHQNAVNMSLDANVREKNKLLEQLDEMTLEAAKMANSHHITRFTDVMDYDPDKGSSYIPGLWHGIPPMAPVSVGYSGAVYDLRKRLIKDLQMCQQRGDLSDFLELTESFKTSLKHQKSSCFWNHVHTAFNGWEIMFNKKIDSWMEKTEVQLRDSDKIRGESEILREAKKVLASAEKEVLVSLEQCIEKLDCHTSTAEGIKEEFVTKTKTLHQVRTNQVKDRLQQAIKRHVMYRDDIKSPQAYMLEKKVLDCLHHCRTTPKTFSNESLKQEFEKMWKSAASEFEINREEVVKKDVYQEVAAMLTENVISRYNTHCMTDGDTLQQCGRENFVLESVGLQKKAGDLVKHFDPHYQQKKLKSFCSNVINQCKFFITQTLEEEGDYSDTIIKDLLKIIDRFMTHRKVNEETEISLKKHICGIAAIEFQKMHNNFIEKCDTQAMLKVRKECYFDDFLERFHDKNQCQKKALQLINLCLKPAVLDYVTESTGSDVRQKLWEIIGSQDDNTAVALNCLILKELLDELNYDKYQKYIHHYNMFVKNWLLEQIDEQLFKDGQLSKIENQHLMEIINKIIAEVSKVQLSLGTDGEILSFVCCLYGALIQKLRLVFPQNALNSVMIEGITYKEEFADHLTTYLKEMKKMPINPYQTKADVRERLRYVLFKSKHSNPLLSCTEQCPFCKAPCEIARSIDHDQHFSSAHHPLGLCGLKASKTLVIETCSNPTWKGSKTSTLSLHSISHARMETQPWRTSHGSLQSASSQASNCSELTDYWRYVMVAFNERTAKDFGMLPAELPHSWRSISLTDALNSLNRWNRWKLCFLS